MKREALCGLHYARWWRYGDPLAWKKRRRQVCTVEGCDLQRVGQGLCGKHYARQRRYGTTKRPERPTVCQVKNCGRPVAAHALCDRHYRRTRRGLDTERRCRFCGTPLDANAHMGRVYCSKECKEQELAVRRRENHRERWLKRYGLTVEGYDLLSEQQEGRCAICGTDTPNGRNWHVDHDHKTNKVRGLLCHNCNILLGNAHDDPAILQAAIDYLSS